MSLVEFLRLLPSINKYIYKSQSCRPLKRRTTHRIQRTMKNERKRKE